MIKDEKSDQTKEWLQMVKKIAACRSQNDTWQQIAEKLGTTIPSVKSHWQRRKHLLEEESEAEAYKADALETPEEKMTDEPATVNEQNAENEAMSSLAALLQKAPFQDKIDTVPWAGFTPGEILAEAIRMGKEVEALTVKRFRTDLQMFLEQSQQSRDANYPYEAVEKALEYYENGTMNAVSELTKPGSTPQLPDSEAKIKTIRNVLLDQLNERELVQSTAAHQPDALIPAATPNTPLDMEQLCKKTDESETPDAKPSHTPSFISRNGSEHLSHSLKEMRDLVTQCKTHYMIDTENVNTAAVSNLAKNLLPDEMLHLFYSDNSKGLPYSVLEVLLRKPDQIQMEYCICGTPNAMDFQIVTILGFMVSACDLSKNKFCIITDDKGYDAAVQYWKWKGMPVERIPSDSVPSMLARRHMSEQEIAMIYAKPEKNVNQGQMSANLIDLLSSCREADMENTGSASSMESTPISTSEKTCTSVDATKKKTTAKQKQKETTPSRKTDDISQMFLGLPPKKQERWVQVMSSLYGAFCKKHKTKAATPQINARILLEHPDYRASDFKNDAAGFLQKVPAAEINEARKHTREICAK